MKRSNEHDIVYTGYVSYKCICFNFCSVIVRIKLSGNNAHHPVKDNSLQYTHSTIPTS